MNCTAHMDREAVAKIIEVAPEEEVRWQAGQHLCGECLGEFDRSSDSGVFTELAVPS